MKILRGRVQRGSWIVHDTKYWKLHNKLWTLNVNLHCSPDALLIELDYCIIIHLSLGACTMKMSGVARH